MHICMLIVLCTIRGSHLICVIMPDLEPPPDRTIARSSQLVTQARVKPEQYVTTCGGG